MRFTAVFNGTQGPGGTLCPETGRLYFMFDVTHPGEYGDPDKPIASAVMHILESLSGQPKLVKVMEGAFMPRSLYADPTAQMKRESRAKLIRLYEYRLPKADEGGEVGSQEHQGR